MDWIHLSFVWVICCYKKPNWKYEYDICLTDFIWDLFDLCQTENKNLKKTNSDWKNYSGIVWTGYIWDLFDLCKAVVFTQFLPFSNLKATIEGRIQRSTENGKIWKKYIVIVLPDLIKAAEKMGCFFIREGRSPSSWVTPTICCVTHNIWKH